MQGGGFTVVIFRLAIERERGAESFAGLVRFAQIAVEVPAVEQGFAPLAGIVALLPKVERAVEVTCRLVIASLQIECTAEVAGDQGFVETVTELAAKLQGSPVFADGTVEIAEGVAQIAEVLPDRGLEGRVAGEQRHGPGVRLEGRFVIVKIFALELTEAQEGLGLAPRQAEAREPVLRALIESDAGAACFRLVGPAQRVGMGQVRLCQSPLAIRCGRPAMLGKPETARAMETWRERLINPELDPELARSVRHPMDLLGRPGRGFRGIEAVNLEELLAARIEQDQGDVAMILIGDGVKIIARLDGDAQDRIPLAGGCGSNGRGDAG